MSSIFSEGPGPSQSSEAEMAALMKDEPAETPAPEPTPEPAAQAPETAPTDAPDAESQQEATPAEPAPATPNPSAIARLSEENRHYKQQLAQLQGQMEAMQRMFQQPQAQQPQPGPQEEAPPDWDTDPIGRGRWESQRREQLERHLQVQAVERQITEAYTSDVQQSASKIPDFGAAYSHLLTARVAQLQGLGWSAPQIKAQIRNEEMGIAVNALRQQKSPAQAIYDMAKIYGYAPKAVTPPPAAAPDPALQEARAKAAVSLSEGGKPEKGGELSWEDISKLHGAAQESAWKKKEAQEAGRKSIFRE